jgi:tellurite resistance protein TerC
VLALPSADRSALGRAGDPRGRQLIGADMAFAASIVSAASGDGNFVELDVHLWQWGVLLALIIAMLLVDLLVFHREAHEATTREAAIESAVWVSCGVAFTGVIWWWFGAQASGEYISGYLIEKSLSVDNVFVWALIMGYFVVPLKYQHRVLFWGIFGALVLRAIFIFAGVALIEKFDWILYLFGAFLLYTAAKLVFGKESSIDPGESKFLKMVNRVVPSTDEYDGQKLFTRQNGKRLATPLFAVLVLIEANDVVFAVDSVPAVLAISHEQFIVFASNAFAILGLRALYFLLADMHARFTYLQEGLAIILAFVGMKMLIAEWYHIPTALSLAVIAIVLTVSIGISLKVDRSEEEEELVHRAFDGPDPDASVQPPEEHSSSDV